MNVSRMIKKEWPVTSFLCASNWDHTGHYAGSEDDWNRKEVNLLEA
jgi:hypothetical protein